MLDRQHGKIVFECDRCGTTLDTGESEFSDALQELRDNGWKSRKTGADWSHHCDECSEQ